jgi:hypothetical protein
MENMDRIPSKSDKLTSMILIEIHNKIVDLTEKIEEKLNEPKHIQTQLSIQQQKDISPPHDVQSKDISPLIEQLTKSINSGFTSLLESQNAQNRLLTNISDQLKLSLKEQNLILEQQKLVANILLSEMDEGKRIVSAGTATTTSFIIINTINDPGHPIKAYRIDNDGPNPIYVGFNIVESSIWIEIADITSNPSSHGFDRISSGQTANESFNRNVIKNIYILSSVGNSDYRAKLAW